MSTSATLEKILSIALLTPMDDPSKPTCRWGAPILFWGPPGIGKSGRVENVGLTVGLPVETLYLSTLQPEDLSGIPMPDGKGGVENVCSLGQVRELTAAGKGILFLDELTTARPAMQGAGLGAVYTRRIAGKPMPGRVRIVGAANPPEQAAGGWHLTPPMANRFIHFNVEKPGAEEWGEWLLANENEAVIPIEEGEATITRTWNDHWSQIRGLGASFIKKNPDLLYAMPVEGHKDRGKAWASPRSWEVGLRGVAAAEALGMKELGLELLTASCGAGPAAEWASWVAYADLPHPKDALENGYRCDKRRLDVAFAVLRSCVTYALGQKDKAEQRKYVILAWGLLEQAMRDSLADLALASAVVLIRAGWNRKAGADVAAASTALVARLGETGMANLAGPR